MKGWDSYEVYLAFECNFCHILYISLLLNDMHPGILSFVFFSDLFLRLAIACYIPFNLLMFTYFLWIFK